MISGDGALRLTPAPATSVLYQRGSIVVCHACGKPLYKLQQSIYVGEPAGRSAWKYAPVTVADLHALMDRSDLEPGQRAAIKAMSPADQALHCDRIQARRPGDFMDCAACGESFAYARIHDTPDGASQFADKGYSIFLAIIPPEGFGRRAS